ncbi:MAG: hypothetical protein KAQ93_04885, partial [Spirochaetales bacterium]|nr:hypothetical protein [Spirochaetales bacterium]
VLAGCATGPSESEDLIHGIDSLVAEIAFETVQLIPVDRDMTLAVYYFTVDGRESNISDYLISGLTTEIANLAGDGITMVSRQGLDRVMSEYSFMVSDLVSEETQVDIGELLGADVILIGFISPLDNYDKINIQLIEVETGAVLGGFFLDYILESGFIRDSTSEVITIQETAVQTSGISTITTIYENFDGSVTHVSPSHYEEYWGDRIVYASARTGTNDEGFGFLDFEAELDHLDMLNDWNDSDLTFYLNYKTDWIPENQDGIAVRVYPEGFTQLVLVAQQPEGEELKTFITNVSLNPDEWTKLLVPFKSMRDISHLGELKPGEPVYIGFGIPFRDNYNSFNFRDETFLESRLRVDDLGFFLLKEPDMNGLIEAYEDEVVRAPGVLHVEGSHHYVDYSESDEGELKLNEGVNSQNLYISIEEGGPGGRFLRLSGEMKINDDIMDYLEDNEDLYVVYGINTGIDWSGFNSLSLLIRSETFENCYFQIIGGDWDQYYSSNFSFNSSWSSVKKPFSEIDTEGGTMADLPLTEDIVWMRFFFSVPRSIIRKALKNGILEFEIDLDQIILQE